MSKFINRKADARQGAFLAVKVNSLNSSRVLCSLSLSLLMAQSSPHLNQRMSREGIALVLTLLCPLEMQTDLRYPFLLTSVTV